MDHLTLMPFFSMVDRRKKMHRDIMDHLAEQYPELLQTAIPYASDIERMGLERMPVPGFVKKSRSTEAYRALWQEIKTLLTLNVQK